MALIKTSELTGAALDWAVGECLRPSLKTPDRLRIATFGPLLGKGYLYPCWGTRKYAPSEDPKEGHLIIEREGIALRRSRGIWYAMMSEDLGDGEHHASWTEFSWHGRKTTEGPRRVRFQGPTALIAALRCYVASKMGDPVQVPPKLLPS